MHAVQGGTKQLMRYFPWRRLEGGTGVHLGQVYQASFVGDGDQGPLLWRAIA